MTPRESRVGRLESALVFVIFAVAYALAGVRIADLGVVDFGALERLGQAFLLLHASPPDPAALAPSLPPVGTLVLLPFAAFEGLVTSGLALPICSALLGAATLVVVDRMLAAMDVPLLGRLPLVGLLALNPMFAFHSMNGTGDAAHMLLLAFGMLCFLSWGRDRSPRDLIGAGLALGLAALAGYESIGWTLLIAVVIAGAIVARGRRKAEVQGSLIAYLAPLACVLALWVAFNAVVHGDALGWVSPPGGPAVNAPGAIAPDFDLGTAIEYALRIQLVFPLVLLAIPALLVWGRDWIGMGLLALIVLHLSYLVADAAVVGSVDAIELRDALVGMILGLAAMGWVHLRARRGRGAILVVTALVAAVSLPLAWAQMESYPHQDLEQAFTRAVSTGEDQEGSSSRGGLLVGTAAEREIAGRIDELDVPDGRILTDERLTYAVIADAGGAGRFLVRSGHETAWEEALADPAGRVGYVLVLRAPEEDPILRRYPGAVQGEVPELVPVLANDRYALLRVAAAQASPPAGDPGTPGSPPPG